MSEDTPKSGPPGESKGGWNLPGSGSTARSTDPLVGKRFGNCLLQRKIGAGAMGWVYLAHHVGLNKPVAIKIMSAELIGSEGNVECFLREAQMAASLEHPHVVQVFDVGEANGLYYLAMQYVEGRSLDKILEERGKLPVAEASGVVKKIALALGAAHKLGIVHRDIKPANVLVSKEGQIKVADFGLARSNDSGRSLSVTGQIVGTPYYMSPEQAQALPVDARADLYSLGATFYHLVTGRRPFEGDTPIGIVLKHVNEEAVPPEQVEPSVPPAVGRLILKLLSKKPEDRFESAEDFVRALVGLDAAATAVAGGGGSLAPGAERILELGGESMLDLFGKEAPAAAPRAPARPPAAPVPSSQPPPRQTTVAMTKDFKAGKDNSPEGLLKAEGKPVVGKYLLLREIQKEEDDLSIWEAENVRTKARVALRLLTGHDSDRIHAFYKLAADGTNLKHPNILHVIECHSDTDAKGRVTHFMAVELVQGLTLEAIVGARMLPPKALLELCAQAADALEFAHQKQKLNLSLCPQEIQVEPPSRALIAYHNFGASPKNDGKARAAALERAPYLAPEQVPNVEATVDATTDVYRLGAVLYWVVTGRAPFEASSLADYYQKILTIEPKAPRDLDPKLDPGVEAVIRTAMRKEKELRYTTAAELAAALRKLLKTDGQQAPASPTTRRMPRKSLKARLEIVWKQQRLKVLLGGTAVLLVAGLAYGTMYWRSLGEARSLEAEFSRAYLEALRRREEGKFDEALAACRRALAIRANDERMEKLARDCQRRVFEAAVLRNVAQMDEAWQKGAEADRAFLERLSGLELSVKELERSLSAPPTEEEARSLAAAGIGSWAAGNFGAAETHLLRALSLGYRDPAVGLALARTHFARILTAGAVVRVMGSTGDRDPRNAEWHSRMTEAVESPTQPAREGAEAELADVYAAVGRGELERAKTLAGGLLERLAGGPLAPEVLLLRAWASGGEETADLDAAIKARRNQPLAYVLRALRQLERVRFAEAALDFGEALRASPNQPVYALLRARARQQGGDLEGALTDLSRAKIQAGSGWEYRGVAEQLEKALPERLVAPK